MTRKDTIMIAVLVNAALLVVLFFSAIKNPDIPTIAHEVSTAPEITPVVHKEEVKKEIKTAQGDEIDQVLKEFSEKKGTSSENSPVKIDFAKELEAITKAANEQKKTKPPASKEFIQVVVKKGDVLEKIARANHTSVDEIVKLNQLKSTVLQIGQKLKIPQKGGGKVIDSSGSGKEYYQVQTGDNPWTIAVKNHMKLEELLRLNGLNEEKARRIKPGDRLRIR